VWFSCVAIYILLVGEETGRESEELWGSDQNSETGDQAVWGVCVSMCMHVCLCGKYSCHVFVSTLNDSHEELLRWKRRWLVTLRHCCNNKKRWAVLRISALSQSMYCIHVFMTSPTDGAYLGGIPSWCQSYFCINFLSSNGRLVNPCHFVIVMKLALDWVLLYESLIWVGTVHKMVMSWRDGLCESSFPCC